MQSSVTQDGTAFDAWKLLTLRANESPATVALPVGPLLVPVSVWHARRRELIEREYAHGWPLGVWLAAGEGPSSIARDLDDFSMIAVHFPSATDGRGCFTARLLRERHLYRGKLRAFGKLRREQLAFLRFSGFDSFRAHAEPDANAPVRAAYACEQGGLAAAAKPPRQVPLRLARSATARAA